MKHAPRTEQHAPHTRRPTVTETRLPGHLATAARAADESLSRHRDQSADEAIGQVIEQVYALRAAKWGSEAWKTAVFRLGDLADDLQSAGVKP